MMIKKSNKDLNRVEQLRKEFVADFPRDLLMNMSLEQYAIGRGDKQSFCYRLEYEQDGMGRIRSARAGSQKYGVWYDKNSEGYLFTKKYGTSVEEAFYRIKKEIVSLIFAGENGDDMLIDKSPIADMVKFKILAMYYPHKYLTIYTHLPYFCSKVGVSSYVNDTPLIKQRKLIQWKDSCEETRGMNLLEFVDYLYKAFGKPQFVNEDDLSFEALLKKIGDFDGKHPKKKMTSMEVTQRSQLVSDLAKARANGYCQLCHSIAPFYYNNGKPYLETHHIISLADNGRDDLCNVVALCPNCHKKMHYLRLETDFEYLKDIASKKC